jgi:hypothetical protein
MGHFVRRRIIIDLESLNTLLFAKFPKIPKIAQGGYFGSNISKGY